MKSYPVEVHKAVPPPGEGIKEKIFRKKTAYLYLTQAVCPDRDSTC